jgi:plastocyanin
MRNASAAQAARLGLVIALASSCGGGSSSPNPSPLVVAKASGDQQTGPASQALPQDLRIVVTRDGSPAASVAVTWSTTDGSLSPASGTTDASGNAASSWTLGPTDGAQSAQAAVQGATGSPVVFAATATGGTPPPPPPNAVGVSVENINFTSVRNGTSNPAVDSVAVGGTVTWTWVNTGTAKHSVQSTGTTHFTSSSVLIGNNMVYQFQFNTAGTYTYNCAVHGTQMTGRIVVR